MAGYRVNVYVFYVIISLKYEQCLMYSDDRPIVTTISFLLNLASRALMAYLKHRGRFDC